MVWPSVNLLPPKRSCFIDQASGLVNMKNIVFYPSEFDSGGICGGEILLFLSPLHK
jgi:hypothetical protein